MKTILPLIALFLAGCTFQQYQYEVLVLDKVYTAASTSTGVGYGMTFNGNYGMVVTTDSRPEKYVLIVRRLDNGVVVSESVSAGAWVSAEKGQRLPRSETLILSR